MPSQGCITMTPQSKQEDESRRLSRKRGVGGPFLALPSEVTYFVLSAVSPLPSEGARTASSPAPHPKQIPAMGGASRHGLFWPRDYTKHSLRGGAFTMDIVEKMDILDRMVFDLDLMEGCAENSGPPRAQVVEGLFFAPPAYSRSSSRSFVESPPSITEANSPYNSEVFESRSSRFSQSLDFQWSPEEPSSTSWSQTRGPGFSHSAPVGVVPRAARPYQRVSEEQKTGAYFSKREKANEYVKRCRERKKEAEKEKDRTIAELKERLEEERHERIRLAAINEALQRENEALLRELLKSSAS
uniref:BZIP domain-containing protein n=1 Tax=Steinernema glaseri TaxID=37863 RepID=A0A1I8A267_9BILA